MAFATLNGAAVLEAVVRMESAGAWTAEVSVDAQTAPIGRVTLAAGSAQFAGTALRAGVSNGSLLVRVVGGAGGLARELPAKRYADGTPARVVAADILAEAGEALSPASDAALLGRTLAGWTRVRGRAGEALRVLTQSLGATWRVLADGTVWIGVESWPEADPEHVLVDEAPQAGRIEIADESASLVPGVTFQGQRVVRVEHRLSETALRTVAWTDAAGDNFAAALEGIVRGLTAGSIYLGLFPAKVIAQNADGTLELQPDDSRLPGMSRVPIRYGIPGVSVKVAPAARVGIEFEAGDPARPVATVWDSASVIEIKFAGGVQPIARVGDTAGPYPIIGGNPLVKA
jgi:hypothetical protein